MENIAIALIGKVPEWYVMVFLPLGIICGIWVFSHLRRDKQGKLYWFRKSYEDRKQNKKLDAILQNMKEQDVQIVKHTSQLLELDKRLSRIEILDLISHKPHSRDVIFEKWDEYQGKGYNSYIGGVVADWARQSDEEKGRL